MNHRKHGRRVLGLIVIAALGLMAFAAAGAQAAQFLILKKAVTADETAGGVQEGLGKLLVPNLNLTIECEEFEVKEGLILKGGAIAHVKLLYKGCLSYNLAKTEELPCHVSDVGGGSISSLHITASALLLPVVFGGNNYVLADITPFFVNFLSGTGCPLPLKAEIKGKLCGQITAGNDTSEPLVLFNKEIQEKGCSATGDLMQYGINDAFVDGAAKLFLTGVADKLKELGVS